MKGKDMSDLSITSQDNVAMTLERGQGGRGVRSQSRSEVLNSLTQEAPKVQANVPRDEIALSGEAQDLLTAEEGSSRPGKSGNSPAHMAEAFLANNPDVVDMPFGKLVSTIAKGGNLESFLPKAPDPAKTLSPEAEVAPSADLLSVPTEGEAPGAPDLVVPLAEEPEIGLTPPTSEDPALTVLQSLAEDLEETNNDIRLDESYGTDTGL